MSKDFQVSVSLNLPNSLSLGRILLIPLFVFVLLSQIPYRDLWATIIFILVASSDSLDGYLARIKKQTTSLGQFLDPLADKLLISAALITLVGINRLPVWIAIVIIGRELAVFFLRLLAKVDREVLQSSPWGKSKTLFQVIAVAAWILVAIISMSWFQVLAWILMTLAIVFTIFSGIDYFVRAKRLLFPKTNRELR